MSQQKQSESRAAFWKQIGQFVSILVQLFTHITSVFKLMRVGPEILEWITGDGKEVFEKEFLMPLALRFGNDDCRMMVDLDATPDWRATESEPGKPVRRHHRGGTVLLERRGDDLYADGKKLVLYFSPRQKAEEDITHEELDRELRGRKLPNVNLIYALFDNRHMIPEPWTKIEFIYCFGTLWHQGVSEKDETAKFCHLVFWPGEKERYWTIDTDYFHNSPGQYPVLVFEE